MKISVVTQENKQVIDITDKVDSLLAKQKIINGICNLHLIHTTAALTTADLDPGTDADLSDAFEAMICGRPYKKRLTISEALSELKRNSGSQFELLAKGIGFVKVWRP